MARDSEDTADNAPSTETKPKSEPRTRNGGKTTPPPEAPKTEAKKPEPEKAKDEPVTEPKKPEKPKAEPEKEKPKAEEPKVVLPTRSEQDGYVERLVSCLKQAQQIRDSQTSLEAIAKILVKLEVVLDLLTPETKTTHTGLVTEAEEMMTALRTRSDRIRIFTQDIPGKHGLKVGDMNNESMLADAFECPVKATAFRDELIAHIPDPRDKSAHESFVLRANGAIAILEQRKRDEAKAEASAREAAAEKLREEQERQAQANTASPFPNMGGAAAEAARKREEEWLRQQQATAAAPDPAPAPAATANQLAVVKATAEEIRDIVVAKPVASFFFVFISFLAYFLNR